MALRCQGRRRKKREGYENKNKITEIEWKEEIEGAYILNKVDARYVMIVSVSSVICWIQGVGSPVMSFECSKSGPPEFSTM